jgi:multiple sugar transport system permease protein
MATVTPTVALDRRLPRFGRRARRAEARRRGPGRAWMVAAYLGLAFFVVWTVIPFYWMLMASIRTNRQIYQDLSLYPTSIFCGNYVKLLTGEAMTQVTDNRCGRLLEVLLGFGPFTGPFVTWVQNSAVIAVGTTFLSLAFGIFAAYAIARLRFHGTGTVARILVFTYLIPTSLLFIPLFQIVSPIIQSMPDPRLQILPLMLAYLTFTVPFCTWLLIGYFRTIPIELEEAALIDGCSRLGALFRVTLPLAGPAIAVVALFSFTLSWNEFLYALVFISGQSARTATVGLNSLISVDVFFWGEMMGGAVLTSVPPVVIYILAQRLVVKGLAAGGVKG